MICYNGLRTILIDLWNKFVTALHLVKYVLI